MRGIGRSILALTAAGVAVGLVLAQQPGGFRGTGGGTQDAVSLLRNEQVKKELGVTDEQMEKLPAALLKAVGGILDDKQMIRLRQIELQQRGSQAFADPLVQKQLNLNAEQTGNIKTILDDSRKERDEIFKEARGGNFQGIQEKTAALRKETTEKVQGVLTADQKKTYKQLLGEEFKLEQKGFGNFKGKKKKTTDE